MTRHTFTRAVADLLLARAGEWVDGRELARVGGFYAFRTRVSDARRQFGLVIENRQRMESDGRHRWKVSEYRTLPKGQQELF